MNKVLLMILDGWGIGKHDKTDAIFNTPTPFMNSLSEKYPHAQLLTCGENVGLPDGQMGNSEVGHLNIGAGRVVNQDLVRINKACRDNSIMQNPEIVKLLLMPVTIKNKYILWAWYRMVEYTALWSI